MRDKWQRASIGRRATGIIVALLLEGGLILLLFTLSMASDEEKPRGAIISTFDSASEDDAPDSPEPEQQEEQPPQPSQATPETSEPVVTRPDPAPVVAPAPTPPVAIIPLPRNQVPDIRPAPPRPAAPAAAPARPSQTYGPPNTPRTGGAGDSERVGTAPDGKPLYKAAWYREPTQQELSGYTSTAQSPSTAIIACKTATPYRVEQCVLESESPPGSRIGRAALAAAWQFEVRPPRIGGRSLYGEWVRIRITLSDAPKP